MSHRDLTEGKSPTVEDTGGLSGNLFRFSSAAGPGTEDLARRLDSARRELRLGRLAQARDEVAAVETALERGTTSNTAELEALAPIRVSLKVLAGRIQQQMGNAEEANASFASALALFQQAPPSAEWAYREHGIALFESGRFDEARDALRQAQERGDQSYETVFYLGVLALRHDEFAAAEPLLRDAVKLEPLAPDAALNLAAVLEQSGTGSGAEAGAHYLQAGRLLLELRRPGDALDAFRGAVRVDAGNAGARLALGDTWRLLGKYEEAIAAVEQDSDSPTALGLKGAALHALGREEDALKALDLAVELDRTYAFALGFRGDVLRQLGRFAEALQSLDQAVAAAPGDAGQIGEIGHFVDA